MLPLALTVVLACSFAAQDRAPVAGTFGDRVEALSEPGGYFDTDNLISNERSYLHVVPALLEVPRGGAYVGVGPDTGFSYIAHARPAIAIAIDIRRDNMLLHLLFKALFELAPTRVEYLSLLTGRVPPADAESWRAGSIDELVTHIDQARAHDADGLADLVARVRATVAGFGVPVSERDFGTIARFHGRFISAGLSLQFNSTGRAPQWNYPSYRDLLLETDRTGARRSYLADESDYGFVRSLQQRDLIIPVVGDLSGPTAMVSIGRFLEDAGHEVTAFYASNVEFYLFRQGGFSRFMENLRALPRAADGVLVRSAFNLRPDPGYNSASMTQGLADLVDGYAGGRFRSYFDLLSASR